MSKVTANYENKRTRDAISEYHREHKVTSNDTRISSLKIDDAMIESTTCERLFIPTPNAEILPLYTPSVVNCHTKWLWFPVS